MDGKLTCKNPHGCPVGDMLKVEHTSAGFVVTCDVCYWRGLVKPDKDEAIASHQRGEGTFEAVPE